MTVRDNFIQTMNFQTPERRPKIEWASWWDLTVERWKSEGLPHDSTALQLMNRFGLDVHHQWWIHPTSYLCDFNSFEDNPEEIYERERSRLYQLNDVANQIKEIEAIKPSHEKGDIITWFTFEGCFWFPRTLFGIENHLYSFYDYPELYHKICRDVTDFNIKVIEQACAVDKPDFVTLAEDMSYNLGPMISEALYDEFMLPYYLEMTSWLHSKGIKVIVDSDGDVSKLIPWLIRGNIDGILPLERQAGVDVAGLRNEFPDFLLIGAFDKMCMKLGEQAMREEFERLLPVIRKGGFIPSVDHQTPPDVSLENYKIYARLLDEYANKI